MPEYDRAGKPASCTRFIYLFWGAHARVFPHNRALRPLLFLDVESIIASPSVGEVLPISLVVHHLYSYASEEMQPPHVMQGLSFAEVRILVATYA